MTKALESYDDKNEKIEENHLKEKLKMLIENLNLGLVGKEEVIKISLLTVLAQENLILFGPPGTAKSEIARRISNVLKDEKYFEYLLTKFTTPEEIFGPLSIKELKEDRFYRKTEGYLPTAQVAFLDEVFKANSSILNTLLTIMNERVFHNGNQKESTNLISLVGASNENPSDDSELNALYDRFLVRQVVDYLEDKEIDGLFNLPNDKFEIDEKLKISSEELLDIQKNIGQITIPDDIKEVIKKIRLEFKERFKENNQEEISDRKLVKVLKLLKVSAYTNGREEVDVSDLLVLTNCLWNNPDVKETVREIIIEKIKEGYEKKWENKEVLDEIMLKNGQEESVNVFKGRGTEESPFLIENEQDLIFIATDDFVDKNYYFKQTKDIVITGNWHSIGSDEKSFKGNYNGNNKKISKLNNSLFCKTQNTEIKNLTLDEIDINSSVTNLGGLAKEIYETKIENCSVSGKIVNNASGNSQTGGIVGWASKSEIKKCDVKGQISGTLNTGGIVGCIIEKVIVEECDVRGKISSSTSSSTSNAGGIIGRASKGKIKKCIVNGKISSRTLSSDSNTGGIVGYIVEKVIIEECDVRGQLSSSSSNSYSRTGGIVGCMSKSEIKKCIISGKIKSNAYYSSDNYTRGISGSYNESSFIKNYISDTSILNKKNENIEVNFSDENGANGKSLTPSMFDEKFYRRLGWDFSKTWEWSKEENKPVLKGRNTEEETENLLSDKIDLNTILKANIWI